MTATLQDRPVEELLADDGLPPPPPPTLVLAELALLGVSLATVVGYARLFADGAFLLPIAAAAVVGHGIAVLLRRVGLGPLLSTVAHLSLLPLFLAWTRYHTTTANLLPSGRTLDAISGDVADAWDIFLDISAPVPAAPGFIVVAMATAWVVALASDSLAFRLDATVEALAPATGLFLFASILADEEHRTTSAALFVVAVLTFVLAARVARADGTGRWLATDAGRGARSLLVAGALLGAIAIIPALLAGPRLPGADGESLVDLDGGGGGDDRVTLSPLVDIRSRLVDQESIEAFRVEAASPTYWRLTALDEFDGQIWSSSGSYVEAEGRLPDTPEPAPGATRLTQHFRIAALAQIWLPAAFEPLAVDSPEADIDWDGDSSSLVVGTGRETSDGLEYDVVSILPRVRPENLSAGTSGLDTEFLARFTRLPEATRPIADRYAAEAGSEPDAYEQALALQTWFRTGFRYSLDVPPGHSTNALAEFLDPEGSRSGYCEQFAGAYAVLARSLGLPARVAVGFTPGEEDEDAPGTYVVTGRNAHAWPEVYFAGVGWVPFEPTPGRGAPGAEAYTGLAPDQATPEESVVPTSLPTTAAPGTEPQLSQPLEELLPDQPPSADGGGGGPTAVTVLLVALAGVGSVWLVGVPLAGALRRRRRHQRARGHADRQVTEAWADSVRALGLLDLVPHRAETPTEFARRASADAGTDGPTHHDLARLTTAAAFGQASSRSDGDAARQAADAIVTRARRLAGPWRRFQAAVSPRRQLQDR